MLNDQISVYYLPAGYIASYYDGNYLDWDLCNTFEEAADYIIDIFFYPGIKGTQSTTDTEDDTE